jgi:hypothetical protein
MRAWKRRGAGPFRRGDQRVVWGNPGLGPLRASERGFGPRAQHRDGPTADQKTALNAYTPAARACKCCQVAISRNMERLRWPWKPWPHGRGKSLNASGLSVRCTVPAITTRFAPRRQSGEGREQANGGETAERAGGETLVDSAFRPSYAD